MNGTDRAANGLASRLRAAWSRHRNILITFVLLAAVWEIGVRVFNAPRYILPSPAAVWEGFLSQPGRMLANTWSTVQIIVVGYAIAVLVSIPLALLIAFSRFVQTTLYPLLVVFQIIPKIAVAPLFIVWFGFGFMPKVMLVFLLSFFPIVISAIAGFRSLDADIEDFGRSTGAGAWRMFFKIRLPQSLPSIFTGLKLAAGSSYIIIAAAEFLGARSGVGFFIWASWQTFAVSRMFVGIVVISAMGYLTILALEALERRFVPWAKH